MRQLKGFSLIELMISVAIVGVLATIAIPSYQNYVAKARVAEILVAMDAKKPIVEEYLTTTHDGDCTQLHSEADTVIQTTSVIVHGGVGITGPPASLPGCQVVIYANAVVPGQGCSGGSTGFVVALQPTINTDGSVNWICKYVTASGPTGLAPYLPSNCRNAFGY